MLLEPELLEPPDEATPSLSSANLFARIGASLKASVSWGLFPPGLWLSVPCNGFLGESRSLRFQIDAPIELVLPRVAAETKAPGERPGGRSFGEKKGEFGFTIWLSVALSVAGEEGGGAADVSPSTLILRFVYADGLLPEPRRRCSGRDVLLVRPCLSGMRDRTDSSLDTKQGTHYHQHPNELNQNYDA